MLSLYALCNNSIDKRTKSKSNNFKTLNEPIALKPTASNDYLIYDKNDNTRQLPQLKRIRNGFMGHLPTLIKNHRKQPSISSYSNKTSKSTSKIKPLSTLSTQSNYNQVNLLINDKTSPKVKSKSQAQTKCKTLSSVEDNIDIIYKKMFINTLSRTNKIKRKLNLNSNISNEKHSNSNKTNNNIIIKTLSKGNSTDHTINLVNKKLGFMKGIIDYCYPSQFLFKIKESKRIFNQQQHKTTSLLEHTAEGKRTKAQLHKRNRFILLKKAINISAIRKYNPNKY